MPFVPDSSDDGGASTMFADTPVAYNDKGHAYVPREAQRSRDEQAKHVKAIPDPEDNPVERNAADEKSAIQQANRLKPGAEGRADVLKAAEEAHQRASGTGLTKGRFVPDEQQPADDQEPLQGADAIPGSQADRARQGLAVLDSNEDGPTVTPTPTMGQRVADTVNAAMHAVTGAAGGILGSFTGIGQHLGEVAGEAVTRIDRAARGALVRLPTDGPLPTLEQAQSDQAGAITGQLNKALPEMTEGAQDITDKYIQPVMDNLAAIAPLHGTLGPSGQLSLAGKVAKAGATAGADLARQASVGVARQLIGVDPELAKIAQTASELKYPIDVRPDQVKEGAKFSKFTGQAASDMPFSNSKNKSNQRAFTKNLIDLLNPESTADRLTGETFAKAMTRSGGGIGDIAARTPVPLDDPLRADLTAQAHDALTVGTNEADRVVVNFVKQAFEKAEIGGGVINGPAVRELNSKIGEVARSNTGNDLGRRLNILQDSLQGAVERNASPADVPALREFRRQYAYGKTVEPLVGNPAASLNGLISPAQLSARVTATKAGKHYMAMAMGGPLGDLARVGQLVKEPISSGTAERSLVYGLVKDAGKTLAGVAGGVPAALAYNTLGPRLVRALTRRPEGFERPPFNPEVERNLRANWESDSPTPPVEPTTSPGAGPGIPPAAPPASPLGDTTPDWQTAPGAGPTNPGGGTGPADGPQRWGGGTDIPAVEGTPATAPEAPVAGPANEQPAPRGAASDIPAVPGRPDLPDTVVSGPPSGSEHFTDPETQLELNTPGAQEAMRRISTPPPKIPVGETNSLTPAEEAKWRKQFSLSTPDAARAKDVAAAYAIDPHATELAAQLYDNLPAKFDAEIAKIKARGEANANQGNEAAAGSESAGARPGDDGSAPVPAGGGDSAGSEPVRATEKPGSGAGGPGSPRSTGDLSTLRKKWPGLSDKSDEHVRAAEAWLQADQRLKGEPGYHSDSASEIQDQLVDEWGQKRIGSDQVGYLKELTKRLDAERDRLKTDRNTPGTFANRLQASRDAKASEEAADRMHKANLEEIDLAMQEVQSMARQGRITGSDLRELSDIANTSKDSHETATRLHEMLDAKVIARERAGFSGKAANTGESDGNVRREANPQDNPEGQAQDSAQPQGGQETQEGPPEAEDSLRVGTADPGAKILGTHEAIRQALHERFGQKFIQGLEDAGLLRFATRAEDGNIPARGAMREKGRNGANRPEGTLYVDTLTKDSAPQVLMHELGAHFGIVRLLGEERYRLMLKGLREDLRNDPEVKAAWVDVTRRYTGEKSATKYKVGDKNFMHEVAAQLVEKHPDMPFVRRMINEVRAYFYEKFGPTRFNTLDADLVRGLAASALRKTTKGTIDRAQTPVDFRKAGPQKVSAPKPADPQWSPTDRMRAVKTAREIDTKAVDNAAREHDVGMEFDRAVQRIIASRKP